MANKIIVTRLYGGYSINLFCGNNLYNEFKALEIGDIGHGLNQIDRDFYSDKIELEFDDSSPLLIPNKDRKDLSDWIFDLEKEVKGL